MKNETRAAGNRQPGINEEKEQAGGLNINKCCGKCRQLADNLCNKKAVLNPVVTNENKIPADNTEPIIQLNKLL